MSNPYSIHCKATGHMSYGAGTEHMYNFNNYSTFDSMFESFLLLLEESKKRNCVISHVVLYYQGTRVQSGLLTVLQVATAIAGFDIQMTAPDGGTSRVIKPFSLVHLASWIAPSNNLDDDITFGIVSMSGVVYNVFPQTVMICNLGGYVRHWKLIVQNAQETVCNLLEKEKKYTQSINNLPDIDAVLNPVDTDWMMGYYVRNELKQIKELIDTDPTEAKKRISVMEYMINQKR